MSTYDIDNSESFILIPAQLKNGQPLVALLFLDRIVVVRFLWIKIIVN